MRKILCVLAFAPALLCAQNAKGPCPGSVGLDPVVLQGTVEKPDRKPRRKHDDVVPHVQGSNFSTVAPDDEDRNFQHTSIPKIVNLVGVVDTTGKLEPASLMITDSPSPALSAAVCEAAVQMAFIPAEDHGQKVRAQYKERFTFYNSHHDTSTDPGSVRP